MDLDKNGDVYYTGHTNNGANLNSVSIYKKIGSNTSTLMGNNNILVSRTIVKLRVLMGKVYLIVAAKQTGKEVYWISIIKEN